MKLLNNILYSIGKIVGKNFPAENKSQLFFFFENYWVGGAEKVHADILETVSEEFKPWAIFKRNSNSKGFKYLFERHSLMIDITDYYNYLTRPILVGFWAGFINKHKNPTVFCSNTFFGYEVIEKLEDHVRFIDLIHNLKFCNPLKTFKIAHKFYARVVIDHNTLNNLTEFYDQYKINPEAKNKIILISNKTYIPSYYEKPSKDILNILYIGRYQPELKRTNLLFEVAQKCQTENLPVKFKFVSDVDEKDIDPALLKNCEFPGMSKDTEKINEIYKESDALFLLSKSEGFPMVIMEGMAYGVVPVVTDVGGIPYRIKHMKNGLIINNNDNDKILIEEAFNNLKLLLNDRNQLKQLSQNAYNYAKENFNGDNFREKYRKILLDS
ncbi:MAG: glycosyltransferase family 4 protein [Bacteroidota bacterium]|nr:glycosyltransferase family 4 protein [Bacteroidota bacterium]